MKKRDRGFALASVVYLLLFATLLIPLLYYITSRESKWSTSQKHATVASQLASSGVERGMWKLKETNDHWMHLLSTGTLDGYNYDVDYTDVNEENGVYRLKISSVAGDTNQMLVECTSKDTNANVYKAMRGYARRTQVVAALHGKNLVNSTSTAGDFTIHWGPIYDVGDLYLNTININQLYPRKYAAGSITVVGSTGNYTLRDNSPTSPNTDNTEYYTYYVVPPIVTPDFDYYRALAQDAGTYYANNTTLASLVSAPDSVYFFEKNATLNNVNKFIQGIVIVMKKCTLQGNNTVATTPTNAYAVTAPPDAYLEYQRNCPSRKDLTGGNAYGDTAASNEYPGDAGIATSGSYTFGSTSGGGSSKYVSIKGLLYVGTELAGGTNDQVIHGAVALSESAVVTSGNFVIYYDPTIEIRTAASEIYVDRWEEIQATPF